MWPWCWSIKLALDPFWCESFSHILMNIYYLSMCGACWISQAISRMLLGMFLLICIINYICKYNYTVPQGTLIHINESQKNKLFFNLEVFFSILSISGETKKCRLLPYSWELCIEFNIIIIYKLFYCGKYAAHSVGLGRLFCSFFNSWLLFLFLFFGYSFSVSCYFSLMLVQSSIEIAVCPSVSCFW